MKIKNWKKFQHYDESRNMIWIKVYKELLDDLEWHKLDPLASKMLVNCWLIASEDNGELPELETLAFRLRLSLSETKKVISKLNHWIKDDDSNVLAEVYQDASLDKRREEKKREEKKGFKKPDIKEVEKYFNEKGSNDDEANKFHDFYESKGWMVGKVKMKDWEAASRNWIKRSKPNKVSSHPMDQKRTANNRGETYKEQEARWKKEAGQ